MFKALGHWLKQVYGLSKPDKPSIAMNKMTESTSQMNSPFDLIDSPSHRVPYDESLLERARTQWQCSDWQSLANLDRDTLQYHPERAKLALLAAAGRLQTDKIDEAKQFIRLAKDWGVNKELLTRILAAGVHNSLGRAAAIAGEQTRALQHFYSALVTGTPGSEARLLTQARISHQYQQLGLQPVADNTPSNTVPPAPTFLNLESD